MVEYTVGWKLRPRLDFGTSRLMAPPLEAKHLPPNYLMPLCPKRQENSPKALERIRGFRKGLPVTTSLLCEEAGVYKSQDLPPRKVFRVSIQELYT